MNRRSVAYAMHPMQKKMMPEKNGHALHIPNGNDFFSAILFGFRFIASYAAETILQLSNGHLRRAGNENLDAHEMGRQAMQT